VRIPLQPGHLLFGQLPVPALEEYLQLFPDLVLDRFSLLTVRVLGLAFTMLGKTTPASARSRGSLAEQPVVCYFNSTDQ
jgi:hypothetical protein